MDVRGILRVLGFDRVRGLEAGDAVRIGALRIVGYPFIGEDWGLDLAQLTYLVEGEGLRVYLSADAGPMPEVYDALAEVGPVDHVRLNIFPDGGVARLRVWGRAVGDAEG